MKLLTAKEKIEREIAYALAKDNAHIGYENIQKLASDIIEELQDNTLKVQLESIRQKFEADLKTYNDVPMIPIIREVRFVSGMGLKEAKDLVDGWKVIIMQNIHK